MNKFHREHTKEFLIRKSTKEINLIPSKNEIIANPKNIFRNSENIPLTIDESIKEKVHNLEMPKFFSKKE